MEYVRVEDEMFDEVLELLGDLLPTREDVRVALEAVNEDSVWLALHLAGKDRRLETPVFEGYEFVAFRQIFNGEQ